MRIVPKRLALALGAVSSFALLSACAGTPSASSGEDIQIAYLTASSANTWLSASGDAMDEEAKKAGVKITEFDAKFEPGRAAKQIQDVITSKKYKGIVIATSDGAGVIPALEKAMDAGLKVVVLNQIVGDKLDTPDPQVPGISASVLAPPRGTGERLGQLAVKACDGLEKCRVVYMYGIKGTPFDAAVRAGFDSVVATNTNIQVAAEAEGGFLGAAEPRKAVQDILQALPDFEVFVGAGDQQVSGALLALGDAGKTGVKTIGVGASTPALKGIADGTWFGDVAGAPADEGRSAFKAMLSAIKDNKESGGIDVVSDLPDGGLITQQNVSKFSAQWAG